ncbi:MAG: pyrroloquinoline quinone-dependent dehydrogenase [Pseudomonadota bacterium]
MNRKFQSFSNCALLLSTLTNVVLAAEAVEWQAYGRDVEGTRYLPTSNITRDNVQQLEVAWTYRTGEADPQFATSEETAFEATPIVLDGVMYLATPLGRVMALDPATGNEYWNFDPAIRRDIGYGDFASRGLSTWLNENVAAGSPCKRMLYVATAQSELLALDAANGTLCTNFGDAGRIDLRQGLRIAPFETQAYTVTSPPLVENGLVVVGSSIGDNSRPNPASGEVRAFDAITGELRWTWDPVPQDPTDPAYGDWSGELAHDTGAANAWSVISADPERDLVFIPTSSPAPDYYGALRLGDNRYANSVVALQLSTGKLVWSFQTVHHDLWDYDNAAPPALVTLTRNGRAIPAVLQATKTGMLFVLHRETGEPLFPVEERAVPHSDIPGEIAAATQPFTSLTPPLSPHSITADEAWGLTEADQLSCRETLAGLRNEGIFTPPSLQGSLVYPSNIGGAHWGGVAIDPVRQIAVVPVNRTAWMVQLLPRENFSFAEAQEQDDRLQLDYEYNRMTGTPYVMRRRILLSPSGLPCTPPPWGSLVAVDLQTGGVLWDVPLGAITQPFTQEFVAQIKEEWGSINLGGPIVTAGGIVFIGASLDSSLHAYDIETGRELWRGVLPASARATPMSYELASGEQFVVIAVGGNDLWGAGDHLVAFRLPKSAE